MDRRGCAPRTADRALFALLRAAAALSGTFFILAALLYSGYLSYTDIDAPELDVQPGVFAVDETGRQLTYGRSRLAREGRIWRLHLTGSATEIGDAHGRLTARLLGELDGQIREILDRRYGSWVEAWTAAMLLRWDYRGADRYLPESARLELAALAEAVPEAQTDRASSYHRLFMYQCVHGLAQRLDDIVVEGSMFAAAPKRSGSGEPGNLIIGRTLSLDLRRDFEADRIVMVYRPDGRYPFVSVGWPGLTGVVTGINSRGIFVAVNAARTDDPLEEGAPLPLVLRKVLEEADALDRAIEIVRDAELRTSGIVLIGDGAQRKSVVLEVAARDREDRRVARGEDESIVWTTNHMVREQFEGDLQNDWIRRYTSSGYRYDRLAELLPAAAPLTPEGAVSILRDRRGEGGATLGLGNRNALENLATTHSVIVDATAMVMWVAEGPSTLGRYRAFDLGRLLGREEGPPAPLEDLPPDTLLFSEEYRDYQEAIDSIDHARELLSQGNAERALWSAKVALALAPDVGELHRLLGDIERDLGNPEAAIAHYRRYLELVPGRRRDPGSRRGHHRRARELISVLLPMGRPGALRYRGAMAYRSASLLVFGTALLWGGSAAADEVDDLEPGTWYAIPDTKMRDVCPPDAGGYDYSFHCEGVITAWGGATMDTTRGQLILWGGGHADYKEEHGPVQDGLRQVGPRPRRRMRLAEEGERRFRHRRIRGVGDLLRAESVRAGHVGVHGISRVGGEQDQHPPRAARERVAARAPDAGVEQDAGRKAGGQRAKRDATQGGLQQVSTVQFHRFVPLS